MRFARNENGEKIEVQLSGQRAICNCCGSEVIGRKGRVRPKHWYHKSLRECDTWYEPITQWHIDWQNHFPKDNQEIELIDKKPNIKHRADIRLNNGLVLEVQNSPIKIDEIEQRERFYNKNGGLIWILNGENLLKKCSIFYQFERKEHSVSVSIPEYVEEVEYYNLDEIRDDFLQSSIVENLKLIKAFKDYEIQNGSYIRFDFYSSIDFYSIIEKLKEAAFEVIENHYTEYQLDIWSEFEFNHTSIEYDRFINIYLTKQYWRQFIDEMKSPVYIDNLRGLSENHLYYYQKNRVVDKDEFIKNHLKFT